MTIGIQTTEPVVTKHKINILSTLSEFSRIKLMHHLWAHQKARSSLMELRCSTKTYFIINYLCIHDNILSLECITTNVERRNGMMLDSAITKRCAVRMGSTKVVKIEQTLTILWPILFNILSVKMKKSESESG